MIQKNKYILKLKYLIILLVVGIFSCSDDDVREVTLFEKGTAQATASSTSIDFGETVDFASTSTKVQTLTWTFAGGTPATSTEPNVTVTYAVPGTFEATLLVKYIDNTIDSKAFTITVNGPDEPLPFGGTPTAIPGTIEAENYDLGGQGVAYNDTEPDNLAENAGSPTYREDDGIDVEVGATITNIGFSNADEWAHYTVNVANAGSYDFDFQVASGAVDGGKSLKLQLFNSSNGTITDLVETGDFANTGGWGVYTSIVVSGVNLAAGTNTLRVLFTGGGTNFDKIIVTEASNGGGGLPLGPLNIAFATDNVASDQGYIDLLETAGHTVTAGAQWANLDAAGAANLNTFDLVIISRNTNSGQFGDAARPAWTTVTKPILNMSAFVTRNNRLQNFNSDAFFEGAPFNIIATDESHPVFTGIDLVAGSTGDITTVPLHVAGISDAGNGTLIGTTPDGLNGAIAFWDANTASYAGADVFAAKRMFLAATAGGYTFNEIGAKLFLNCVEFIVTGTVFSGSGGTGETLGLFTEASVTNSVELTYEINNHFLINDVGNAYEGSTAKAFTLDPAFAGDTSWAMASIKPTTAPLDISAFENGYYNIAVKSDSNGTILFRIQQGGTRAIITFNAVDNLYGFARDGQWHNLKIPMSDIIALQPNLDLTQISDILVLRSDGDVSAANNYDFFIDNFYLSMD